MRKKSPEQQEFDELKRKFENAVDEIIDAIHNNYYIDPKNGASRSDIDRMKDAIKHIDLIKSLIINEE